MAAHVPNGTLKKLLMDGLVWRAEKAEKSDAPNLACISIGAATASSDSSRRATPFGISEIDHAIAGGLRRGCVHEFYCGCYELLGRKSPGYEALLYPVSTIFSALLALQALKQSSTSLIIWIGKDCWPTPFILQALENNPAVFSRCIFLNPPSRSLHLWAIESALRSPHAGMVAFSAQKISLRVSQRFSLAARSSGALGVLLSSPSRLTQLSAAHSRWQVRSSPSPNTTLRWSLELHALKGAPMPPVNNWTVEFSVNSESFLQLKNNDQQAVSINIFPRVVDSGSTQATVQELPGEIELVRRVS